jgi:hypothetical protein
MHRCRSFSHRAPILPERAVQVKPEPRGGERGPALGWVVVGNAIITSSYLLTGSPLAAILSHVAMHVAAVLHGMETSLRLPPYY